MLYRPSFQGSAIQWYQLMDIRFRLGEAPQKLECLSDTTPQEINLHSSKDIIDEWMSLEFYGQPSSVSYTPLKPDPPDTFVCAFEVPAAATSEDIDKKDLESWPPFLTFIKEDDDTSVRELFARLEHTQIFVRDFWKSIDWDAAMRQQRCLDMYAAKHIIYWPTPLSNWNARYPNRSIDVSLLMPGAA